MLENGLAFALGTWLGCAVAPALVLLRRNSSERFWWRLYGVGYTLVLGPLNFVRMRDWLA